MRWRLRLEEYEYTIEYKKGKENTVADALSRLHPLKITSNVPFHKIIKIVLPPDTRKDEDNSSDTKDPCNPQEILWLEYDNWKAQPTAAPLQITANRPHWTQLTTDLLGPYDEEQWLVKIHDLMALQKDKTTICFGISSGFEPIQITEIQLMLRFLMKHYPDKKLRFAQEPPREYNNDEKKQILFENHDNAQHLGENKTIERIKERHYWTNIDRDICEYIKKCDICQRNKLTRIRPREESIIPDTPQNPNDKIALDIIGPLVTTTKGNQFILSIQDCLTKYLLLIPLDNQRADSIINALIEHYVYVFSSPKHILTDQGQNFVCKLMESFEKAFKIKHIKTTSFHPQSNGALERTHGTVKDLLRTCIDEKKSEWDEHLNLICMAYNTSVHSGTGYTPFELTFGHKANLPSAIATTPSLTKNELFQLWKHRHQEYLANAKVIIETNKKRYKNEQDRKIRIKSLYNVGDLVLLHNEHKTHKLDSEWTGPYEVLEVHTPNYLLKINNKRTQLTHGNRIKLYNSNFSS
ncbi:MAG TPA: hypothetical protein ACHBZA_04870 [Arsenophonus apicola]